MLPELQRWASKLFFKVRKSQIRMFKLIPLSQLHKLLGWASLQIANPQIFKINPQISIKYSTFQKKF
jgi:hypothetical protein